MESPYRSASIASHGVPDSVAEQLVLVTVCIVLLVAVFRVLGAHGVL